MNWHRRNMLTGMGAGLITSACPAWSAPDRQKTRLILLGTAGGPRPRRTRSGSAQAIVIDDEVYVIDCGDGVARQLHLAGIPLRKLRHVFITHHHSDHDIDLGPLLQIAWLSGLVTPVDCWGPAPTSQMIADYLRYQGHDIDVRTRDEGRRPLKPLIKSHDIAKGGLIFENDKVRVTSAVVPHPPLQMALAFRFDTKDRSIVISGDTKESEELIALAKNADVLVHEVMLADRVKEMLRPLPDHEELARSVISHHTSAEGVGRVASAAGVKLLVLSHFVPAEDPDVPDEEWLTPVRRYFSGPVIVGRDLMEI